MINILAFYGGEGGIRTHGGLHLAGFQDQSLKPLDHLSESTVSIIIKIFNSVNRRTGNAFMRSANASGVSRVA